MASPPRYANSAGPHRPYPRTPLFVGGAIVLVAALVLTTMLLTGRIGGQQSGTSAGPGTTATAPAVPATSPAPATVSSGTPAPQPNAAPTALPGFGSGPALGGSPAPGQLSSSVVSVRVAAQSGYDRFVVDLGKDPLQQYEVLPQATSTFTLDPKGEAVTLQGSRGVLVILRSASNHGSFTGSTDRRVGLPAIREARLTGDFEGVVSWALGIDGPGFVRVQTLTGPSRLVVDVQS